MSTAQAAGGASIHAELDASGRRFGAELHVIKPAPQVDRMQRHSADGTHRQQRVEAPEHHVQGLEDPVDGRHAEAEQRLRSGADPQKSYEPAYELRAASSPHDQGHERPTRSVPFEASPSGPWP